MQAQQSIYKRIQPIAEMSETRVERLVNRLVHLNEQSEIGFDAAAHHIRNRALKIWLKSCAQQRREFAKELEAFHSSHDVQERSTGLQTFLARIHRGWIDARSIMVIGRKDTERFILEQVQYAEKKVATQNYIDALDADMPNELRQMLQAQYAKMEVTHEHLDLMLGDNGELLIVQLFDSAHDTQNAVVELNESHRNAHKTSVKPLDEVMKYYDAEQNGRMMEIVSASVILGIVSGGVFGSVIAAASTLAASVVPALALTLIGSAFGLLCGLIFGLIGGHSNVEEDKHIYESARAAGKFFLFTQIPVDRVPAIRQTLQQHRWASSNTTVSTS